MTEDKDDLLDEFGLGYEAREGDVAIPPPPAPIPPPSPLLAAFTKKATKSSKPVPAPKNAVFRSRAQLGFGPVTIAPGSTDVLQATPSKQFRAEKLFVTETAVGSTTIENIFIGHVNQLGPNAIPSTMFSAGNLGHGVSMSDANAGTTISITVRNNGQVPCTVAVAMFGTQIGTKES